VSVLNFDLRVAEDEGEWTAVVVAGEVDIASCTPLRQAFIDLASNGRAVKSVVVDMAAVTFIDSTGLGILVGATQRFRSLGRDLVLRTPSERVREVLSLSGLDNFLSVEPTR
jgi:anti-sigma B factor antagonist